MAGFTLCPSCWTTLDKPTEESITAAGRDLLAELADPAFVAMVDQASASLGEWAQMLGAYRARLEQAGFSHAEAMRLVEGLQASILDTTDKDEDEG